MKLVEKCLSDTLAKQIRAACGPRQLGAGVPGGAQIALEALRAATSHPSCEEVLSTDIKNAFGSLYKERALQACGRLCPQLFHYLLASWSQESVAGGVGTSRGCWAGSEGVARAAAA